MVVSIRDVAARAGVSVGTVSNVLNGRDSVSPDTTVRVREAIDELGYVRNDAARQLRAGRSRSIGFVVLDIGNPFFAEVARGAEERAAEEGLVLLLGSSDGDAARERSYLELFREQRVAGVLVTPATGSIDDVAPLVASGIAVTLVDREAPDTELCSVSVDDEEGGYLATAHLLSLGRRRLWFVAGPLSTRQVADRLAGAERAVAEVDGARLVIVQADGMTVLNGRDVGDALDKHAERPDGIFAANDLLAVGVLQALMLRSDVRVPDDIAMVGYDDIDFAATAVVPLTSVRQPAALIGYTAVDLLLRQSGARLDPHERTVRFRPELQVRASTRADAPAPVSGQGR